MADAGFFKGTSAEQDSRFANKQKKLLQQMKFPDNINVKIDMIKVNLDVIKPWITKRLQELLGIEDDVVIEFVFNQLDEKNPDPKMMQINLTGFLGGSKARLFIGELWKILTSAQSSSDGIPIELVELKKKELLRKQQEEDDRLREIRKREEESQKQIVKIDVDKFENRTNGNSNRRRSVEKSRSQQERKHIRSNNESENNRRKSPVRKHRTPVSISSSEDEKIERKKKEKIKKRSSSSSTNEQIEKKSKRTRSVSVSSSSSSSAPEIEVEKIRKKPQSTRRRSRSRSSSNHRHKKSRKHDKSSSRKHRHHNNESKRRNHRTESKQTKNHRHNSTKKKYSKSPEHEKSLSPKKPRLESQIRVQTPPNRAERTIAIEESRLSSRVSIVNKTTSHDESSEVHHSSEDENEIDLREHLLREKAIKSMKHRQNSSLSNDNSSKSLITERIVYQTQ